MRYSWVVQLLRPRCVCSFMFSMTAHNVSSIQPALSFCSCRSAARICVGLHLWYSNVHVNMNEDCVLSVMYLRTSDEPVYLYRLRSVVHVAGLGGFDVAPSFGGAPRGSDLPRPSSSRSTKRTPKYCLSRASHISVYFVLNRRSLERFTCAGLHRLRGTGDAVQRPWRRTRRP